MRRLAVVLGLALAAGLTVSVAAQSGQPKAAAGAPEAVVYDAASAMAFLATLSGEWQAGRCDARTRRPLRRDPRAAVTFKTKAAGSAVVQTTRAGQPW